jgi:hypothetical protein
MTRHPDQADTGRGAAGVASLPSERTTLGPRPDRAAGLPRSPVGESGLLRAAGVPAPASQDGGLPRYIRPGEAAPGRVWEITLPAGLPLLNLNDRDAHWGRVYKARKALKAAALVMIQAAKVPHLERVAVIVIYDPPPDWRDRDSDNIAASVKPLVDALRPPYVKAGNRWVRAPRGNYVLPEDDSAHVLWTTQMIGPDYPLGRLRMIIQEVP